MSDVLREWIRALTGCAVFCAAALTITPPGRVRRVQALVCSLVMLLAFVSPLYKLDTALFARSIARFHQLEQSMLHQAEQTGRQLNRSIIEQECAAYILDKAADMGATLSAASVTARWDEEGFWYPWQATLDGTADCKAQLQPVIEAQLGIPEQRQYWSCDNDA